MDHKQLATSSGRRRELLYPNRNSCSVIELPRKARFKTRLPYAPDAWQRFSQHSIQKSPSTPLFSRTGFVLAPRGTTTFAPLFLRLDLARNFGSSSCRYGPRLTLLRPQPADNDTRPGFSEAGEPVLRNLRGADALRESVNRVKSHPKSLNKLACYSRHMRGQRRRPLDLAVFKSNPRFFESQCWYSRAGCRQPMLARFLIRSGQRQSDQCFSEPDNLLWQNLRGV